MVSTKNLLKMDVSYPGIGIKPEITIVREYLSLVEESIERMSRNYIEKEERKNQDVPPEEYQYVYLIGEEEIPRIIRNPAFVSVYSLLESSLTQLLKYAQEKEVKSLSLKDIGRGSLLLRANKYMEMVLNYGFKYTSEQLTEISDIYKVRNFIVHSNATLDTMNDNLDKTITKLDQKGFFTSTYLGQACVTSTFLMASFSFVETALTDIMEYMESIYSIDYT